MGVLDMEVFIIHLQAHLKEHKTTRPLYHNETLAYIILSLECSIGTALAYLEGTY